MGEELGVKVVIESATIKTQEVVAFFEDRVFDVVIVGAGCSALQQSLLSGDLIALEHKTSISLGYTGTVLRALDEASTVNPRRQDTHNGPRDRFGRLGKWQK